MIGKWAQTEAQDVPYEYNSTRLFVLFFTVGVTEQWDRLPMDIVESPFLNVVKNQNKNIGKKTKKRKKQKHFGHGPGHPALVGPSQAGQLDQMTSRDPFQNQLSSDSVNVTCQLNY